MKKLNYVFIVVFNISILTFSPVFASVIKQNLNLRTTNLQSEDKISIKSEVNPGMELIAIMLWLSSQYPTPLDSKYKSEVWKNFSKYRQHSAILKMKKLSFYTDFTEEGLLLSDFPALKVNFPAQNSWYQTLGSRENVESVLNGAKEFAKDTNFWKFHLKQQTNYLEWTNNFAKEIQEKKVVNTVQNFFRYTDDRQYPHVTIFLEPLNNWGAHAINYDRLTGELNNSRVAFQIGPTSGDDQFMDSPLNFHASNNTIKTFWHECTHVYLSQVIKQHKKEIDGLDRLFNTADQNLARQNIKTWSYAFEENLVRGIVAAFTKKIFGEEAYKKEIYSQNSGGFIYTYEIAELISSKYLSPTARYTNFDEFMPEIIALLESKKSFEDAKKPL